MGGVSTRTGLLEGYLAHALEIERLARNRIAGIEPMSDPEKNLVLNVLQHSIGLERALERWIGLRIQQERSGVSG